MDRLQGCVKKVKGLRKIKLMDTDNSVVMGLEEGRRGYKGDKW